MLLPLQGASIGAVGVTQGVATLALGYVLHWAFSPPFKHVTASATSAYQPISISTHNPRRQPLCSCGHADVSPWPFAAQRPYVLMLLCPYVSRVSGSQPCHATASALMFLIVWGAAPIPKLCFLCSLCSYVSAVSAKLSAKQSVPALSAKQRTTSHQQARFTPPASAYSPPWRQSCGGTHH